MLDIKQKTECGIKPLLFVTAVQTSDASVKRIVFKVDRDLYVVVKWFPDPTLVTVKFWTVDGNGLKTTMDTWKTRTPWEPTQSEIDAATRGVEFVVSATVRAGVPS